jgi:transposase
MSLDLQPIEPIPDQTARVARAAFPQDNICLTLRDELGTIFDDIEFAALYSSGGRHAEAPWRLALVTVFQFVEQLSDRQVADAVRARIDWKYLLGLELADPGFDASVLCEFRSRLLEGGAEVRLLEALLETCRTRGWLKARGRQRTDSTHVLARVRAINRLECATETLRHALNTLAVAAPGWLSPHCPAEWGDRYARRVDASRIPTASGDREAYARQVGQDGHMLLEAADDPLAPQWIGQIPAVPNHRRGWIHPVVGEAGRGGLRTQE